MSAREFHGLLLWAVVFYPCWSPRCRRIRAGRTTTRERRSMKTILKHTVTAACLAGLLATALFLLTVAMAPASHAQTGVSGGHMTRCVYEDSNSCVWDAKHMGNGGGQSFIVDAHGHVTYVSHKRAHRLAGF